MSICFTSRRNEWHRISKIRRQLEKKSLIHMTKKRLTWVIRQEQSALRAATKVSVTFYLWYVSRCYRLRQPRLRHIKVGKFRPQRLRSETLETPKLPGSAVDVFRFTTISTR